jgi:hypothetical protein
MSGHDPIHGLPKSALYRVMELLEALLASQLGDHSTFKAMGAAHRVCLHLSGVEMHRHGQWLGVPAPARSLAKHERLAVTGQRKVAWASSLLQPAMRQRLCWTLPAFLLDLKLHLDYLDRHLLLVDLLNISSPLSANSLLLSFVTYKRSLFLTIVAITIILTPNLSYKISPTSAVVYRLHYPLHRS